MTRRSSRTLTPDEQLVPVLTEHLRRWLGTWPPPAALHVVGAEQRASAGWDGRVHPALGVADATGAAVLSVPPSAAAAVGRRAPAGLGCVLGELPALLGEPGRTTYQAVFRWTTNPADLPEPGEWFPADAPTVPAWLRPFGGQVLLAADSDGSHLAGVGIKRHDDAGHELAVVTAPLARGRGLAKQLVAQAARQVLRVGAMPTYLHEAGNEESASVAEAAGFYDLGWTAFGVSELPWDATSGQSPGG